MKIILNGDFDLVPQKMFLGAEWDHLLPSLVTKFLFPTFLFEVVNPEAL